MFNLFKRTNVVYVVKALNLWTNEVETIEFINDPIGFNNWCVYSYIDYDILSTEKILRKG